jgi:hypothetical protein
MRALMIMLVTGCNQVYGLDSTRLFDAPYRVDARPDALPGCPAVGTELRFTGALTQVVRQPCTQYNVSLPSQLAVAQCPVGGAVFQSWEGRIDDSLGQLAVDTPPNTVLTHARLTPEGDELYFRAFANGVYSLIAFTRGPTGRWENPRPLPLATPNPFLSAAVTRGPDRRVVRFEPSDQAFHEYAHVGAGTWQAVATYRMADFGLQTFYSSSVTGDGLRLVIVAAPMSNVIDIFYAERAAISDPFTTVKRIPGMSGFTEGVMTEDCSRVYFSALGSVFAADVTY